ncbi:MAG TPA: hypothetical protein P5270_06445 [Victivallales bacterium]|nr:hypothetical protein [Victivallales bacterium]HRR28986.1 hypothetical protein [Victivallales bacterium]
MKKIFQFISLFFLFFLSDLHFLNTQELCVDKLKKIIFDKVFFDEKDVIDAISYIRKRSQEIDPEGKGINIIIKDIKKGEYRVTLELSDIPAADLLRYICMAAELDLRVEQFAVIISKKQNKK